MRYTCDELRYLEANYRSQSIKYLAQKLNRTVGSVKNRLWRLGYLDKSRWWTKEQIDVLKKFYAGEGYLNLDDIAKRIGKNKANICRKARQLGLPVNPNREKTFEQRTVGAQRAITARQRTPEEKHQHISATRRAAIQKYGHPRGWREIRICPICGRFFDVEHSSPKQYCGVICGRRRPRPMNMYSRGKGGKREDLGGMYFRSRYEANYARYLNFLIVNDNEIEKWEYESEAFYFEGIKRGVMSYTPDFKIFFRSGHIEYHEVKGWDYPKGITARKRMGKYHPKIKLVLVGEEFFKAVREQGFHRLIPNWE